MQMVVQAEKIQKQVVAWWRLEPEDIGNTTEVQISSQF